MTQPGFDFSEKRSDQLERSWRTFHEANPRVFNLFTRFCFELINRGCTHCSADMIGHRVRFEMVGDVVTKEPVKINNNHIRFYADLFIENYPQHGTFFNRRRRISEDKPACEPDIQVNDGGPRKPNAAYDERMAQTAHLSTKEFSR